jgi:hypothetical protein
MVQPKFQKSLWAFSICIPVLFTQMQIQAPKMQAIGIEISSLKNLSLSVTQTSSNSAEMQWVWNGTVQPFSYNVEVTDLTNNTVVTSFSTTSKSAVITGLITGNSYRFAVQTGVNKPVVVDLVIS